MARILLLEDDTDISSLIVSHLRSLHYTVDLCANGAAGLQQALRHDYDLIIMDLGLPQIDGLDVCKQYRQANRLTPILMLTARDTEVDRVIGLEIGADDYMGKPFSIRELQARVRAILRRQDLVALHRHAPQETTRIASGALSIDASKRTVRLDEREVLLTATEFELLYFLASNPGRVYNREQLLDHVWGYTNSLYEHTVNSNINRLRSKIEEDPSQPKFILTLRGVGYKFNELT